MNSASLSMPWRLLIRTRTALAVHRGNHRDRLTWSSSVTMLVDHQVRGRGRSARFRYEPALLDDSWRALAGSVDVVLAAPPCTGHSTLNYNRGRGDGGERNTGDARNDLYLTVPTVAVALGAPVVIIENVPAVVQTSVRWSQLRAAPGRRRLHSRDKAVLPAG